MSAKDSSAIAYVACLVHRPRNGKRCECERCTSIRRVCRLASDHVTLKRVAPQFAKAMNLLIPKVPRG